MSCDLALHDALDLSCNCSKSLRRPFLRLPGDVEIRHQVALRNENRPPDMLYHHNLLPTRDYHDLKINGYRRSLDTDSCGLFFSSLPFRAGGRKCHIVYRPKGNDSNSDYISFFLALDDIILIRAVCWRSLRSVS